jgi:CheY-like chemotaxis protein
MEDKGGILTISLDRTELKEKDLMNQKNIKPGYFIVLSIKDTGMGIKNEIRDRIFDPYFTTKEIGKGSGMGLSVVHGIVHSYNGIITVESEPAVGTELKVYLPENKIEEQKIDEGKIFLPKGTEKILLVDDEPLIIDVTELRLRKLGYDVTSFTDSEKALKDFKSNPDKYDIIIADQTMPGIPGLELSREMLNIKPGLPIILCTGYSSKVDADKAKDTGIKGFIMKPIDQSELAVTIRTLLQ